MKILGINGSSRKDGNTALLMREVFKQLEDAGMETSLVQLSEHAVAPCRACFSCAQAGSCVFSQDDFNELFDRMTKADGILLGSPVYSADVSARMKAFLERAPWWPTCAPDCSGTRRARPWPQCDAAAHLRRWTP